MSEKMLVASIKNQISLLKSLVETYTEDLKHDLEEDYKQTCYQALLFCNNQLVELNNKLSK